MATKPLESWIDGLQVNGRYSFVRSEALSDSGLTPSAVNKALQRAVKRGRIVKIKEYFYVLVPLEYTAAGSPPVSWFVQNLMVAMNQSYYVGLLSAAAQHGASHHQPQEFQVMTDRSVRPMKAGRTRIRFFASKYVERAAVQDVKTPTGFMRVATPETTVVDLVRFARSVGRLDSVANVIADLSARIEPRRLIAAIRLVNDVPNTQRLGYILDQIHQRRLANPIREWLRRQSPSLISFRSGRSATEKQVNGRWNLLIGRPLEPGS
jgi:predicted transcriptional regulator of viral defense system